MAMPPRVQERPDPKEWGEDELMTLAEAVALHWPRGPLTVHSLRVAVRDGVLAVVVVAGRYLTTRRAIAAMSVCRPLRARAKPAEGARENEGRGAVPVKTAPR